jgi:hypothetical protein
MPSQEHAATLLNLTGDLWPVPGAPAGAVLELRKTLLGALRGGQAPGSIGLRAFTCDPAGGAEEEIRDLGDSALPAINGRVRRRTTAVAAADPLIGGPRWSGGQKAAQTLGPFQDRGGRLHWFDVFPPGSYFRIFTQGDPQPVALLPFGTALADGQLNIPTGSVWLRGRMLGPGIPTGTFAGLRIEGGAGTSIGAVQLVAGSLLLAAGASVQLVLSLATEGLADFPDQVDIEVSGSGIRVMQLAAGSMTAFGTAVPFTVGAGPLAISYDALIRSALVVLTTDADTFDAAERPVSGTASIQSMRWALPLTESPAANLAEAEIPGWLALLLDAGLEAAPDGMEGSRVALGRVYILASPAGIMAHALAASAPGATRRLEAWFEEGVSGRSGFEITWPKPFDFWYFRLASGAEATFSRCELGLHIDRPLRASGERLETWSRAVQLDERDANGARFTVIGFQPDPVERFAIALSNALLTVAEPSALELFATLQTPSETQNGTLLLRLPLFQLVPMLPDPYAANFDLRRAPQPNSDVRILATVIWTEPFAVQLDVRLDPPPFNMFSTSAVVPEPRQFRAFGEFADLYSSMVRQIADSGLTMLDVSTNSAQLGVTLGYTDLPGAGLSIRDFTLHIHGSNATVFMLPQFQWEPVFNIFNPKVPGEPEGWRTTPDDGGPTQAAANSVRLVPVRPLEVLNDVVTAYSEEQRDAAIMFTLPFGIQAVAQLNPNDRQFAEVPNLEITSPRFRRLEGAPQLSLIAGTLRNGQVSITGRSKVQANSLGQVVGPAFNTAFLNMVPVERINFSGYGATLFSRWILKDWNSETQPNAITQVAFDAFNGRTSYERVMLTIELLPCFARMVRTIIFERRAGGAVTRWDSGWIPTTPGKFQRGGHVSHKCAVEGLYNIREVRDTDYFTTIGTKTFQAVYYDADVGWDSPTTVVRGGNGEGRVVARRHLGFVQVLTIPDPPPAGSGPITGPPVTPQELCQLLQQQHPVGGPIDCEIRIGNSTHTMKVTSLEAANVDGNQFSVGPTGIPSLRGAGQWSVAHVNNVLGAVEPVPASRSVPLVRAAGGAFRWAEPADLFSNNPAADYAFLFSSGAQRVLFQRPRVLPNSAQITSDLPPKLADPYALLKGTGLFPKQAIPFPAGVAWGLDLVAGALRLTPATFQVPASIPGFNLLKTPAWWVDFDYNGASFTIDSVANWLIKSKPVRQSLTFPLVGEVMKIVHEIEAPTVGSESFPTPQVIFDGALQDVAKVLDLLRTWAPDLPAPLKVDASFSGSTFRLSAVADFAIQDKEGNSIDCGMGKLKGNMKLGAELSVEIVKRTTTGSVFFEVTGSWQQQIFPKLYGGGLMRFRVGANSDGSTSLELDACVTGSVGGDLIPKLIAVEATVKYGYFLFTNPILPGFMCGMEGRAKLLEGLVAFKFGVEGRIGITRTTDNLGDLDHICKLHGEILVSGSVTVAWVLPARKSFRTQFDVNVDWKMVLVAAKMGLLPVP